MLQTFPAVISDEEVRSALLDRSDDNLIALLGQSMLTFDGNFTLSAPPEVYSALCPYYPMMETVVQDVSGKHLHLSLNESVPMGTETKRLQIEVGAANITEAIISPESIAAIPAYLLRFVPYYGSSAVLIATALRQAFYRASREHGADQLYPKSGDAVMIDVESLLATLGHVISRATFFRIFKEGSLDWFVRRADPVHRFKDGRIARQPNTYTYRGMVLVPGDAQDLYTWFTQHQASSHPTDALSLALKTPRDQILTFPYRTPDPDETQVFDQPASVHEVFQAVLGVEKMTPTQAGLCDQVASHLIRPESFLAVPWYWFQKVLPELGSDLGMLYLMSKNCCYIDWARGKDRNTFWVIGGLSALQKWIRSETLPKRIPALKPSPRGRPRSGAIKADSQYTRSWRESNRQLASQYLCRIATRKGDQGQDWQLRVSEIQLTAQDEVLKQAVYAFLFQPPADLPINVLKAFAANNTFAALMLRAANNKMNQIYHFETLVAMGICQNETLNRKEICQFDTLADSLNCYFETLVSADICQFDTILKILLRLKHTHFFNQDTQPANTQELPAESGVEKQERRLVGYFNAENWSFAALLSRVNPILAEKIHRENKTTAFLSWLIEGSLTPSIHSPMSFAISRTLETNVDAGGAALRLALLPAQDLASLVWERLARLEAGYLGQSYINKPGEADLQTLLTSTRETGQHSRLLKRLCDGLGLHEEFV